jgi:hypothetical protein
MRSSTRGSTAAAFVGLLGLSSCFSDPPNVGDETSTSDDTGATSSSGPTTSSETDVSDDAGDSSTTDVSDDTGESSSGGDSSTTGDAPLECGCPDGNVFCDGFENGLRPWLELLSGGGSATEELDAGGCGPEAARLQVVTGNTSAALAGHVDATTDMLIGAPYSVRALVRPDAACGNEPGFVRLLEFRLPQSVRGQWYSWRVAIHDGEVRLTAMDHEETFASWEAASVLPPGWIDVRIDFDLTAMPPAAQVSIDDVLVVESGADAPALSDMASEDDAPNAVVLGPYQTEAPFIEGCAILYDEVWVAPQ